ncbi:hypothetical protein DBR47_13910 [Paucibacter sp. KBW04]|uniref:sugar phosphate nucleotidyltransferase n=1 Tax=Paucibacter sp. KBW04 TaxID=2153361 RepID=UPI000F561501|nr:sugar phosphate nucleotidyltransferase [Paucibacter sp. KBW04]RQO58760.1 hypothetical protein DBR47_13910 [Paucibacter sp. KBW04]
MSKAFKEVPVVILCGGQGVVLGEGSTHRINKALVQINGKPLFWWVLLHYAQHGAQDFLLPVGLQAEEFQRVLREDFGASTDPTQADSYQLDIAGQPCRLRVLSTPVAANTAQRLLACKPWLAHAPHFALSYSDTLSEVDLSAELAFHKAQGTVATLVSTQYPVRFRILGMRQGESLVRAFAPKPVIEAAAINGGYYLFSAKIWEPAFGLDGNSALEAGPLDKLAAQQQLTAFEHRGPWQHCDAERDLAPLNRIAQALAAQTSA